MSKTDFPAISELRKLRSSGTTEKHKGSEGLPVLHKRSGLYHITEFIQTKMRTLATKQQALLKPKPTETQCYSIYQWKENQAMLKARNRVKQPRTVHACLEQFSRHILTLEVWYVSVTWFHLVPIPLKRFLQDKWGTEFSSDLLQELQLKKT